MVREILGEIGIFLDSGSPGRCIDGKKAALYAAKTIMINLVGPVFENIIQVPVLAPDDFQDLPGLLYGIRFLQQAQECVQNVAILYIPRLTASGMVFKEIGSG